MMYRPPTELPEPEPHWLIRLYRYFTQFNK